MPSAPKKEEKPHYHGHRDRLRQRFVDNGPDSLQDYEIIELILFTAIPRRDVKPLAKTLLSNFGGLPELMNAPLEDLLKIEGMSENSATFFKAVTAISHRSMKAELINKPVLNNWSRLLEYCRSSMAHEMREHFRVLFMNKKNQLIADEIQQSGTVDHTPVYPREIIKRAIDLGATALILVHNHPSGDHRPSQLDVDMTNTIIRAGEPFGIIIHDHIIVSRNGYTSFKNQGLI